MGKSWIFVKFQVNMWPWTWVEVKFKSTVQKALQRCTSEPSFITMTFIVSEINVRMYNVTFLTRVISAFKAMFAALYPENFLSWAFNKKSRTFVYTFRFLKIILSVKALWFLFRRDLNIADCAIGKKRHLEGIFERWYLKNYLRYCFEILDFAFLYHTLS